MITYYNRTLQEKDIPQGYNDPYGIFENANYEREILLENPYKKSDSDIFQVLAVKDSNFVGTEIHFPIELCIDGKIYTTLSGHCLSVEKECRGAGVGGKLTDGRLDFSPTKSLILGGASQMHLSILRKLNAIIFEMPRMIYLRNAYSILENKFGIIITKFLTPIVNFLLKFYFRKINKDIYKLKAKFDLEEQCEATEEIIGIITNDNHRFSERHNNTWFNWVLNNTLLKDERPIKTLHNIKYNNTTVGFFITETRFYKEASHRGFKNVRLGSIIEWGTCNQDCISDSEICALAISTFDKNVDAIEICCIDDSMQKYFSKRNLKHVGDGNVCIRFREDSPLSQIKEIREKKHWRLRPAMGDHSLS